MVEDRSAPEGTIREHHDVSRCDRRVDHNGPAGKRLAADKSAAEQHVIRIGREPQDDPRPRNISSTARASAPTAGSTTPGQHCAETFASGFSPGWRCTDRRKSLGHRVGRQVHADARNLGAAAAATAAKSPAATAGVDDRHLAEVDGKLIRVEAIRDRALPIGEDGLENRAAGPQVGRRLDGEIRPDRLPCRSSLCRQSLP